MPDNPRQRIDQVAKDAGLAKCRSKLCLGYDRHNPAEKPQDTRLIMAHRPNPAVPEAVVEVELNKYLCGPCRAAAAAALRSVGL